MLERGLCRSVLDAVERRTGDRPVTHVRTSVADLPHVAREAVTRSFAELIVPVTARCAHSGALDSSSCEVGELVRESIEYRS